MIRAAVDASRPRCLRCWRPAALCLCAGLGWHLMSRTRPVALAVVVAAVLTGWLSLSLWRERQVPFDPYATLQDCGGIYEIVKNQPGDRVLSENVGALVLSGKTVWFSNLFVYSQMVMRGGWKDAGLEKMLRDREFDLIVTQWDYPTFPVFLGEGAERFSAGALRALAENYRSVGLHRCTDARVIFQRK